jgi:hypothetical protein
METLPGFPINQHLVLAVDEAVEICDAIIFVLGD